MTATEDHQVPLVDPPRSVPTALRIGALLGGKRNQTAWGLLAALVAPIWFLLNDPSFSPIAAFAFLGPTTEVQGEVTELIEGEKVTFEPFAVDGNGYEHYMEQVEILGIHYGYKGPDGTPLTGIARGLRQGAHEQYTEVGAPITVEYANNNPERSRVRGLRGEGESEEWLLTIAFWAAVVFGAAALLSVLHGIAGGAKAVGLMAGGALTEGRLTLAAEPTKIGNAVLFRKLEYVFSASDQQARGSVISMRSDAELSEEPEPIFYHSANPSRMIPVGEIPCYMEVDPRGNLSEGDSNPYNNLWLPTLCCLAWCWFTFSKLGLIDPP